MAGKTSKQVYQEAKENARKERRKKAFNAAVSLVLGDTLPTWSLFPQGVRQTLELSRKKHPETKRVVTRDYIIDQNELTEKVEETRKEREEYAAKKAGSNETPTETSTNPA